MQCCVWLLWLHRNLFSLPGCQCLHSFAKAIAQDCDAIPRFVHREDGRSHCRVLHVSKLRRLSSRDLHRVQSTLWWCLVWLTRAQFRSLFPCLLPSPLPQYPCSTTCWWTRLYTIQPLSDQLINSKSILRSARKTSASIAPSITIFLASLIATSRQSSEVMSISSSYTSANSLMEFRNVT